MTRDGARSTMRVSSSTRWTRLWRHWIRRRKDAISLGWTRTHQTRSILISVAADELAATSSMMATGADSQGGLGEGRSRGAHGASGRMEVEDWESVDGFACRARSATQSWSRLHLRCSITTKDAVI